MTKAKKTEELTEVFEISENSTVGQIFKSVRTKAGKKTEDIANELKIRRVYIEAIEKNDYPNIPESPYGIGFIRSYAKHMGLNEDLMVDKFKEESNVKPPKAYNPSTTSEDVYEAAIPSKKNIYIAIGALVVLFAAWSLISFDKKPEAPAQEAAPAQAEGVPQAEPVVVNTVVEEATTETMPEAQESVSAEAVETSEEAATPAPEAVEFQDTSIRPRIKVFEETWVEVKNQDTLFLSKVLQAGDVYILPNREGLILSVGKINGADLFIGDKQMNVVRPTKKINIPLDAILNSQESQQ